jgi:hypothetical protein
MPLLRRVHLERVFIDTDVIEFLVDHTGTLESILFQDCYSGYFEDAGRMMYDVPVKWHELFTALIEAEPKKLHEFVILPTVIPYTEDGNDPGQPPETFEQDSQRDFWAAVHAIRDEPKGRRIFPHGSIDDKYGMLFDGYEENMEAYMRGDDQRAYDRLMVLLEENKARK